MKDYCCGCGHEFGKKEKKYKPCIFGVPDNHWLCKACQDKEDRQVAVRRSNDVPSLLRSYAFQTGATKYKLEVEVKQKQEKLLVDKLNSLWNAILSGEMLLDISPKAVMTKTENGNQFVEIRRCTRIRKSDGAEYPEIEFLEMGYEEDPGPWLKVFVPSSARPGDTIRIKHPSKSGKSYIAVIVEYARDHSKCGCGTGIHEGLTFGQGRLDDHGYWQFPCWHCARKAEKRDGVERLSYWPW